MGEIATPEAELFTRGKQVLGKKPRIRRPYTPSPEAIERRKARDRIKSKQHRESARAAHLEAAKGAPAVTVRNRMWRIGPVGPELSKRELREMLVQAMQNTAAL